MTLSERLWRRVDRIGDGCWEWQGATIPSGYGGLRFEGRFVYAHRAAYELTHGPIPPGMYVCHHCDNPRCCRPDHLFLGTCADNNDDMRAKGRSVDVTPTPGEEHHNAKLTEADVRRIRELRAEGMSCVAIQRGFPSVTVGTIQDVARGRTWRHVTRARGETPAAAMTRPERMQ